MTIGAKVSGGTGAGSKWRPDQTLTRCGCGGFIAKVRADQGARRCVRCEASDGR